MIGVQHAAVGEISPVAMMVGAAVSEVVPNGTPEQKNAVVLSLSLYIGNPSQYDGNNVKFHRTICEVMPMFAGLSISQKVGLIDVGL